MPTASPTLRADPRRPFSVDLRDIGRRPGTSRMLSARVAAPEGMALELIGIPTGDPIALDLQFESVVEGVWVSGTATADLIGECSRCLRPIRDHAEADVQELFAYPDSTTEGTADEDEVRRIEGERLDLEPSVRDALLIAMPLIPLCRPDCEGLCATCGERREDLPDGHTHDETDPRWAGLAERFGIPADGEDDRPGAVTSAGRASTTPTHTIPASTRTAKEEK